MSQDQALWLLRHLERGALAHAALLPRKEDNHPVWQGMGFQVGGVRLVSTLGEISEVLKPPRVTALPGVKPWLLGVANVRGRLIPVVDLHRYLGMAPTQPMSQWRVLVVEEGDLVAGLLVELSLGIQHFSEAAREQAPDEQLGELGRYVRRAFRRDGRIYYEAQVKSILRDEKFFEVAEAHN